MADPKIRLKRSAVSGKRPTLANLDAGELALNTYDGNLFARQDTGGVGIATTVTLLTPWQEEYGAGTISYGGNVNVTGNLAVDANTLFVNSANNRIGIGTDNPAYQVEIENTGANALLVLDRTDGASCFIEGQLTRSAFGSVNATPLALAYNSLAVVTIGAGGSINVNPDGDGYTFPTTDGSANQVLQTDGEGNLSFADQFSGVGISSEGTYIGSGVTAFNFVGASVTSITVPSAGFSTISIDFNGINGIFAKTENKFSATEGQTSFSVDYEVGYIDVFLNGVRLNSDNFTATDGGTVGLTSAASAGDAVDIIVYEPQASATPKRVVTNATATAGQTAFTVPSYDTGSNSMDVFLNGIKLDSAEFTETNGTTVTLAVGAALNDELQFISYESDNNFWSLNGGTLHRTSASNPVAIGTNTSAADYLTVGQPGAAGTSLFVHGGARITGILTIGTGSITINGQTGSISGLAGGGGFNSSGNLGVGISPGANKLEVRGVIGIGSSDDATARSTITSTASGLNIVNKDNSALTLHTTDIERLRILDTGQIGIGITNPSSTLHLMKVVGGSAGIGASIRLSTGNDKRYGADIYAYQNTAFYDNVSLIFATGAVGGEPTQKMALDPNGALNLNTGSRLTFGTSDQAAIIGVHQNGISNAGYLAFQANTEHMRITSGGYVGIADTQPINRGKFVVRNNDTRYFSVATSGLPLVRYDDNAEITHLTLANAGMTAAGHGSKILFNLGDSNTVRAAGGAIRCRAVNQAWTSTSSTQDSDINIDTTKDGTSSTAFTFHHDGTFTQGKGFSSVSLASVIGDASTDENQGLIFFKAGTVPYSNVIIQKIQANTGSTDCAIRVAKHSNGRSINATGTINASGADYAEYMHKCGDFTIEKGDICGINSDGLLTNVYDDSISFVIKSTDPSYVGGDTWNIEPKPKDESGNEMQPKEIKILKPNAVGITTLKSNIIGSGRTEFDDDDYYTYYESDQYDITYENPPELDEWYKKFEEKRINVDRISFSGQVPINGILNGLPGQYIIPIKNSDGSIGGIAKNEDDLTFSEYKKSIAKIIKIQDDGRPYVIVKVA